MLSKLSITQKLSAGFGVIILIIVVLVVVARQGFSQVNDNVDWTIHTYQVMGRADQALEGLLNIETGMRGFALTGQDDFLGPYDQGRQTFEQAWTELKKLTSDNPTQQKRLDDLRGVQQAWLSQDIEGTLALRRQVNGGTQPLSALTERIIARQDKTHMDGMRALLADIRGDEQKLLGARSDALQGAERFALGSLIIGGLVAALLALGIAAGLSTSIRRRISGAIEVARGIAGGRLDQRIDDRSSDEIGQLYTAFAAMQQRLREMIHEILSGSQNLVLAARNIASTSNDLSNAAQDQSSSAATMAATVEQLTVSISHVANSATEARDISADSGQQSHEGGAVIQQTLQSMGQIAGTVQTSADQVAELGRQIEQITSIVNVITAISEQTNLLALNAAIEAARAGEQGRGFAVVADEVRLLAQRTGKSTQEIGDMIQKIQGSAHEAVNKMQVGVEQVNDGLRLAQTANQAIDHIRGGSGKIIAAVDQISVALQQQSAASQDVARNVERIAQMAQQANHGIAGASRSAEEIERLAQALERQVRQFSL
ncbi:methyl-accepting chemotaxis protein [Pseudomonas japonica]|uniref:methyl-accepting chemotaxis protein n=2 Tax=Pseudomonas japonica TaxID=256466 RepID=UPI0015E423F2|nr:methyl-accepting chemotaxis protein [Pseudomonas japonica]MBA1245156.1 methyl-accepting chemotaxis protein [Pseudomonas japonica]